jgi:phosphoribosylanthranilate isomerase
VTAVKVCGLTRPEDVRLACELGAAYVGFNFSALSPRRVDAGRARELAAAAAAGTARVGVFVDEDPEAIRHAIGLARLHFVQLHRDLGPGDLDAVPLPVIAVVRMAAGGAAPPAPELLERCAALLFDAAVPGQPGGTGRQFDWRLLEGRRFPVPFFLAGGLDGENVGEAIRRVRPDAVDVASGVESAPGVKDPARLRRFFDAVREADAGSAAEERPS